MVRNQTRLTIFDSRKNYHLVSYLIKMAREFKLYRYAYINFVANMLSSRYRRSFLGFFWTLLSPFFNLAILAVVFSLVS